MNIKKISLFSSSVLLTVSPVAIMMSCSSSVDQVYVDEFYNNIIDKQDWKGNENVYASSIYDSVTFRRVFKDQLPTNEELAAKGFKLVIESDTIEDKFGSASFSAYLRNKDNTITYLPTPKPIFDGSEEKESIISFTVDKFLKAETVVVKEFTDAYSKMKPTYTLNAEGKDLFQFKDLKDNISFNNEESPYYLEKLFTFIPIPGFRIGSFEESSINQVTKVVKVKIYLKSEIHGKIMGPGQEVTLSL